MDYHKPEEVVQHLVEITNAVEKECPFGKTFGVSGIGEGVVWIWEEKESSRYWFKVKGEEHAVTKVKTLKELSETEKEHLKNISNFVSGVTTESRLRQGLDYLREMNLEKSIKNIGTYIKWVVNDVIKEESDTMKELGCLDEGKVKKAVTGIASSFYKKAILEKEDETETEVHM